ncbi:MAG: gamma-glutamyltransferase [Kiloniellaceae bacterium]|nr:gamma-glutamyltransferase [Kiloniellaceae bacterium]
MLNTPRSTRGMIVAPHHLAAEAGLHVLREGGNAIEAMIAALATIAVVYPHMNGLGGDNCWLVRTAGGALTGIDACGRAWQEADPAIYRVCGMDAIPARGPLAAITVAGAVSGWKAAAELARQAGGRMPLERLFEDAIYHARHGFPASRSQHDNTLAKRGELEDVPGFAASYLPGDGGVPGIGELFRQPALAVTLERMAEVGLDDFYRGELARAIAADLEAAGSPIRAPDLAAQRALRGMPLSLRAFGATVYNLPPPTQGLAALMILGLFERLGCREANGFDFVHGLVEATKRAFRVRDAHVTDPAYMDASPEEFLEPAYLDSTAAEIDRARALLWNGEAAAGDTVWLGAIDNAGHAVSCIQSLYWEFGSGVVLPATGITWQNRGASFELNHGARNPLMPGRKPFHTIQPPLALLDDGRVMVYGTMGGDGQPQTQAAIFTRYAAFGQELQQAVTAPRWLLGRTWGEHKMSLRIEDRFSPHVITSLAHAGHNVETVGAFNEVMGHAGAIVRHRSGVFEGAADPRGDGLVATF